VSEDPLRADRGLPFHKSVRENKSLAILALIAAGLVALAKPAAKEEPSKRPLIPFAGSEKARPRLNGAIDQKSLQPGRGPSLK
jgi:hypothetical protein